MLNQKILILNKRVFVFCLIIIQSIGPRIFQGQGIVLSIVIVLFSINGLKHLTYKDILLLISSFLFLLTCKLFNPSFSYSNLIYQFSLIFSICLFLVQYKKRINQLQKDFFTTLRILIYHALIGYIVFLLLPSYFKPVTNTINNSFYYIFYVSEGDFMNIKRNTGFFWEPGVFQLAANLYLFYCIKFNKKIFHLIISSLAVLSSFSTTGLLILSLNFGFYIYTTIHLNKKIFKNVFLPICLIILLTPIFFANISDKVGGKNTSGLARLRDIYIGIELIKEKPIVGHGIFNSSYLKSKGYVYSIENDLFSKEYLESSGEMSGGYTNGLLGLIAWFGIPISLLLYFYFFKNKFVNGFFVERLWFCTIPLISMISEPIAYTSFFLMFPFSYLILNENSKPYIPISKI